MSDFDDGLMMGVAAGSGREEIIDDLIKEGVIIPEQDINDEFRAKREAITADWFNRHSECKRGTGQFAKMYPEADHAEGVLIKMGEKRRITTEEFLILYKEIKNF